MAAKQERCSLALRASAAASPVSDKKASDSRRRRTPHKLTDQGPTLVVAPLSDMLGGCGPGAARVSRALGEYVDRGEMMGTLPDVSLVCYGAAYQRHSEFASCEDSDSSSWVSPIMDTLPALGEGIPLHHSLRQMHEPPPPLTSIPARGRAHLVPLNDVLDSRETLQTPEAGIGPTTSSSSLSPPPSPPRLRSRSPTPSRGVPKMGSMDDTYCDRIRSTR